MLKRFFTRTRRSNEANVSIRKPIEIRHASRSGRIYDRGNIFHWIVQYKIDHDGNSPSINEISKAFQIPSKSVTKNILKNLCDEGRIRIVGRRQARSICVIGGSYIYSQTKEVMP